MGCTASSAVAPHVPGPNPHDFAAGYVLPQERKDEQVTPASSDSFTEGSFHSKYVVGKKIGSGAFAEVYVTRKATGKPKEEELAVKVLDSRAYVDDKPQNKVSADCQETVEVEVEILRRISIWDSCIQLTDAYTNGLFSYIVMEKCDGTFLSALKNLPDITEKSLADLLRQALSSLCCIHAVDVVHRDVKPDNYLIKNGIVKLCDFGMSEILDKDRPTVTGCFGTAPYMSPEMLMQREYGVKTDVWSWACMAYVLFFGKFPYQPPKVNAKAMKAAIVSGTPAPSFVPDARLPRVSPCVSDFLRYVLQRDPAERPMAMELLVSFGDVDRHCDGTQSLKPMIASAKHAGAFNAGRVEESETSLDSRVRYLQAKYHGAQGGSRLEQLRSKCRKGSRVQVADVAAEGAI